MTTRTGTPTPRLAACSELAEQLTPGLANSLRWLATHPGSGATLVVEGFVRDGELVLVADLPGEHVHDPRPKESGSRRPRFRASVQRGLLSFALSLAPGGRKSHQRVGAPGATRLSRAI